jgi:hypothetical protein
MEEKEDIYYVEIPNNKRFKGVYVNEKVRLENEIVDEEYSLIKTEVEALMFEIKKLNIDTELKKYLFKRDFEIYRLKRDLNELRDVQFELIDKLAVITSELEQLKHNLLGAENDYAVIEENIDED